MSMVCKKHSATWNQALKQDPGLTETREGRIAARDCERTGELRPSPPSTGRHIGERDETDIDHPEITRRRSNRIRRRLCNDAFRRRRRRRGDRCNAAHGRKLLDGASLEGFHARLACAASLYLIYWRSNKKGRPRARLPARTRKSGRGDAQRRAFAAGRQSNRKSRRSPAADPSCRT